MTRNLLVAGALGVSLTAPAWADCTGEIGELEQRLDRAGGSADQESTQVETGQGDVMLQGQDGGVEPQENWFGSPATIDQATEELGKARRLANSGDEPGCMHHVDLARQIMSGLQP